MLAVVSSGCQGASRAALRPATAQERAKIGVTVDEAWEYESRPPENLRSYYHVQLRRPTLRPRVVAVRVSPAEPRYASVLVERRGARAVLVLKRDAGTSKRGWGYAIAGPALSFPLSCTFATPRGVRDLLCPDPW